MEKGLDVQLVLASELEPEDVEVKLVVVLELELDVRMSEVSDLDSAI